MPRRYTRKTTKRTTKRKPRTQRRFRRKRFNRGPPALRGTTIPPVMMAKLQYTKIFSSIIDVNDHWTTVASNGLTYPTTGTTASLVWLGSHCCTPMGDAIRPASFGSTAGSVASITEDFPIGLQNWSTFYEQGLCFGSSISIVMYPNGTSNLNALKYVLLPIATQQQSDVWQPNSPITGSTKSLLDALDYSSLISYPGARSGYIKDVGAGPTKVKMFRKTKGICGLRDIKDNQFALAMTLPTISSPGTGSNTTEANPDTYAAAAFTLGWLWYFRVFTPTLGAATADVEFTVRIKYYSQLMTRRQFTQVHYTPA